MRSACCVRCVHFGHDGVGVGWSGTAGRPLLLSRSGPRVCLSIYLSVYLFIPSICSVLVCVGTQSVRTTEIRVRATRVVAKIYRPIFV